jgi:hypothetical protein
MTEETFELWLDAQDFEPDIVDVHWSIEHGLRIGIAAIHSTVIRAWISFDLARAVQCLDEGYRLRSIPLGRGLIWRVNDSEYLSAFRGAACGTMDSVPLNHWLVTSANECVDVLSELEPVVTFDRTAQQAVTADRAKPRSG